MFDFNFADSLLDAFGLKRRQAPRIAVHWLVDVQVRDTEHFVGFYTQDMSLSGACLKANTPDAVERVRSPNRRVSMRVRLPPPYGVAEFKAELKWERQKDDQVLTGWAFNRIDREARRVIGGYIEAHPEDVIQEPGEATS